jgi:hypothetical protein
MVYELYHMVYELYMNYLKVNGIYHIEKIM